MTVYKFQLFSFAEAAFSYWPLDNYAILSKALFISGFVYMPGRVTLSAW